MFRALKQSDRGTEYLFKTSFAAASAGSLADFDAFHTIDGGVPNFFGNWVPERGVGVWRGMEARFVPVGGVLSIVIVDRNGSGAGNDFALDEIRFVGAALAQLPPPPPPPPPPEEPAIVPEPATWALMLAGFGLVGGVARRRRALAA